MTLYAIYNPDGSISQANKVYDPDGLGYDKQLLDRGLSFIKDKTAEHLCSHDHWMVDTSVGALKERPVMPVTVQATTIKAGAAAVLLNIPKGAAVSIIAAGSLIHTVAALPGDELEFNTEAVPCSYSVVLRLWPFKDCTINIEAVAK